MKPVLGSKIKVIANRCILCGSTHSVEWVTQDPVPPVTVRVHIPLCAGCRAKN